MIIHDLLRSKKASAAASASAIEAPSPSSLELKHFREAGRDKTLWVFGGFGLFVFWV